MIYRDLFPVFSEYKELVYLDNAATTQKPMYLIKALEEFMIKYNASPHRGAYKLSVYASQLYEESRNKVKSFLKASNYEVVFTPGATESINMIAHALRKKINDKKNIVVTITSHHSNILPFMELCRDNDLELRYLYSDDEIDKIDENTLMVSFPMVSNSDGKIHDYKKIIKRAREKNALTLLDIAQGIAHMDINAEEIDSDFYVFSGHKMFALNGIGAIVAKKESLKIFDYFFLGGDMIEYVEEQSATYAEMPIRYEAGTQNTQGAYSLLKAIEFIEEIGLDTMLKHEKELFDYAYDKMSKLDFIELISKPDGASSIIAFDFKEVHPHDVASILDSNNICIRAGHHCCQPYFKFNNLNSSSRISFSIYNTFDDIDQFIASLYKVKEIFYD